MSPRLDVDKLDIDKSKSVPTYFNYLKSENNELNVKKLKTVKKLSDTEENDVAKKTFFV